MSLPGVSSSWVSYLDATTKVVYPVTNGDIRVTLLSSERLSPVLYSVAVLFELWADPFDSEASALALHDTVTGADTNPAFPIHITGVKADVPVQNDDPESDLDRWQFTATHYIRVTS